MCICLEIQIEEENANIFFATLTDEHDVEDNVQLRTQPITTDSNQKISRPKLKVIKAAKSLPETNHPLTTKKRRQTIRRTVDFFPIKNNTKYLFHS